MSTDQGRFSDTDSMKSLKMKRAHIKSACTKLRNALENGMSLSELNIRRSKLEECWQQFDEIQTKLDVLEVSDPDNYVSGERTLFEENYYKLASKLDDLITAQTNAALLNTATTANRNNDATIEPINSQLRLPKIALPTFTGRYEEWYPFYDMFNSLIHSCPSVSTIQKFQYLKASLKGEAAEIISSFEISCENYIEAWNSLKARYDNKRKIIQNHVKAIYELPPVKKECAASLRYLIDGVSKHLRALKALHLPTEHWDALLLYTISAKLDLVSSMEWETSLQTTDLPKLNDMIQFLTRRCQALEASMKGPQLTINSIESHSKARGRFTSAHLATNKVYCSFCKGDHFLGKCEKFIGMSVDQRRQEVMSKRLCLNCLRTTSHMAKDCKYGTCKKCKRRHNTLLHDEKCRQDQSGRVSNDAAEPKREEQAATAVNHSSLRPIFSDVLLSTALVHVYDIRGNTLECRVLLDSASQSNFITNDLARRLGLTKHEVDIPVGGISQAVTHVQEICEIRIKSRLNNFNAKVECLVLDRITQKLPVNSLDLKNFTIPNNIKLADPNFHISKEIDLLLGAEIFWNLICIGQINVSKNQPCFQKTHLGWIVSGKLTEQSQSMRTSLCSFAIEELNHTVSKFWKMEDTYSVPQFNPEEKYCVTHYSNTFRRNEEGRFIVTLPIKEDQLQKLGQSKCSALHRFLALERRLTRQPSLMEQYSKFMKEYEDLGHMKLVSEDEDSPVCSPKFYFPHHAVVKEASVTTKLRVVFDGSAKTDTNISLNDTLMAGPNLQEDIFSILTRFRTFRYVLSADISKMYRQILVDASQTSLQRILWRYHASENIKTYELLTVTYGTKSASFLAIQTLHQLAMLEGHNFPIAARIVLRDFYVDDLLTGANTKEEALDIRRQTTALLAKGGFQLRKWSTNCKELLKDIEHGPVEHMVLSLDKEEVNNTLGIQWEPINDTLQYSISEDTIAQARITKRKILSRLAKIFDPLGLLGPITFTAKCIIQQLWILKLDWDESVPSDIHTKWLKYESELPVLRELRIPRNVTCQGKPLTLELHGFSDASQQGYGGCIYLRSANGSQDNQVYLLSSKSRVAPLKAISIPRLELCGAVLLAKLMQMVVKALPFAPDSINYWTDSTIVLNWIRAPSRSWATFVANRVGEIQELTSPSAWNYIGTLENPADLISRGSMPKDLIESALWWKGPEWLSKDRAQWRIQALDTEVNQLPDRRKVLVSMPTVVKGFDIFERFSAYHKLIRVWAFMMRFIDRLRNRSLEIKNPGLSGEELRRATKILVKVVQREAFSEDLQSLIKRNELPKGSKLLSLHPFIDKEGLLRVGGRLKNSSLSYEVKHQLILPSKHSFTRLLIEAEHKRYLHAGAQGTLCAIRTHFWPLSARNTVRRIIRKCITCFRFAAQTVQPLMGDLPTPRTEHSRPFSTVGIDYCGPFLVRESKRRNSKQVKSYVSIFICFVTKAVHIELVMDMSTESFLAALRRFLSRRGRPVKIISDNGTTFVGANRELRELKELFLKENTQRQIYDFLANENIIWQFIPPRSPHFGGIWESAVKSVKFHLKRVAGNAFLNHDEFYTLLTQVEAILNSRPLSSLSNDPNDYSFLSPGHFLVGGSLMSNPEPDLTTTKETRLSRWQRIEQMRQHLWKRWYKEYLHHQQERKKWKEGRGKALHVNDLVLIQEDNTPPLCWPRGRIEAIHPGKDGIVRTATVRTQNGTYKRPAVKLCLLPMDD